jgi:shikimate kinase
MKIALIGFMGTGKSSLGRVIGALDITDRSLTALVAEVTAELSKRGYWHGDNPTGPCRTEL